MARKVRKTPAVKKPTYERIERDSDPLNVYDVLDEMMEKHSKELCDEDCRIALAWRYGLKKNKDGQLVLGKCKKVSELDKQFAGFDFVIILNREAWENHLDESQRRALMHHELCHAAVSTDANGSTKKDARNRTMFRIRKHDIEEFEEIVQHHGCYKNDLNKFVLLATQSKKPPQPELPGMETGTNGAYPSTVEPSANGHVEPSTRMPAAARTRNRIKKTKTKSKR